MAKHISLFFIASLLLATSFAQNLTASDADSKISFVIKNMGINVDGSVKGLKGKVVFNPKNLKASLFDVTVDVSTLSTDNKRRDEHLMKEDFFDVAKYPTIGIKTISIQAKNNNIYFAKALLNMHGISKEIQFDFIAKPTTTGYQFTGGFTINRKDYGVGGNSMTMSDDVKVNLDVVGKK